MSTKLEGRPDTRRHREHRGWRALRQGERGSAAVEFAVVAPVLFLVLGAMIDFGRALWTLNVATAALREGGRYAAAQITQSTCANALTNASPSVPQRVRDYLAGGALPSTAAQNVHVVAECSSNFIRVCYVSSGNTTCPAGTGNAPGQGPYPFSGITPFMANFFTQGRVIVPTAVFRWERAG